MAPGRPARRADVGVRGDRIVAVGQVDEPAKETFDADGLVVAPGFVDPHTHYDAQLYWDGYATPSSLHGVTSVIGGNCGFTLAPLKEADADFTRRMMAKVEGMPLAALENGVDWSWETFGEYLDGLEGRIAVNAGFLVGHCALRRYVLGEEATERESKPAEVEALTKLLGQSLEAGGLGLSTSRSSTHNDGDNRPVPSRIASEEELLQLCDVVSRHEGTTLEAIVEGCLKGFSDSEVELMAQMSARANRPLNWNVLGVAAGQEKRTAHQLLPSKRAQEIGGRVVALTMPIFADNNMSLGTFCALWLIPGWHDILSLPKQEKLAKLRDPAVREEMTKAAEGNGLRTAGRLLQLPDRRHHRPREQALRRPAHHRYRRRTAGWIQPTPWSRSRAQTTSRPSCGRCRSATVTPTGQPAGTCGLGIPSFSAAPTPAPTWTGCWARPTRPVSWPTPSAVASCCRWSGPSSS